MSDTFPHAEARRPGSLDHGEPAAVPIDPEESADREDESALARYRARQAGRRVVAVPHDEARSRLGLDEPAHDHLG